MQSLLVTVPLSASYPQTSWVHPTPSSEDGGGPPFTGWAHQLAKPINHLREAGSSRLSSQFYIHAASNQFCNLGTRRGRRRGEGGEKERGMQAETERQNGWGREYSRMASQRNPIKPNFVTLKDLNFSSLCVIQKRREVGISFSSSNILDSE